jgi:GMP synthase-like glutamine amidotransferase
LAITVIRGREMICYVDMEHTKAIQSAEEKATHRAQCGDVKRRLEETSGDECVVQRYERVTRAWVGELKMRALLFSGNVTDWAEYEQADLLRLYDIIRRAELPILGICGGLQLIAMAHGAPLGPIRRLREGEKDPDEGFASGYLKEWGFVRVHILKPALLFDGLAEEAVFLAAHYWEVKQVPVGYELLASSDVSRVQAIKRIGKPVYGTQFHPEAYTEGQGDRRSQLVNRVYPNGCIEEQTDGRRVLTNFFRECGILDGHQLSRPPDPAVPRPVGPPD